ncbi:MAG TPA: ABC transporter permease, partial [Gemmatimonadaceae bacterium]|nr:ABC transporter permease [Gemmatimonadaceae bacterium]
MLDSLRVATRSLRKQPVFATSVIVSLALGIALNTTMYGMLDALIKPRIEMRDPAKLWLIAFFGDTRHRVDARDIDAALRSAMHTYGAITYAGFSFGRQLFEHDETIDEGRVMDVPSEYFDVAGVRPLAGRTFLPSDSTAGIPPVIITDDLARQLFPHGDSPVGAQIKLGSERRVVIGVISTAANFPQDHVDGWEIAKPLRGHPRRWIIRLRDGATAQDADHEISLISTRIALAAGESPRDDAFRFRQLADPEFQFREIHFALIGAVVAVLLVACTNIANIQLARGIGRRRELALRSALGASRRRLIMHLLMETAVLAGAGLGIGLLLTAWGKSALAASIPPSVGNYIVEPQISWRVLVFALGATLFCLVIVGLLPSIGISRTDPNELLKSGAGTGATRTNRARYAVLVSAEVALALALSCLATVMVRTTILMNAAGPGYDPRPLSTGYLGAANSPSGALHYNDVLQAVTSRLRAVSGVADATATMTMSVDSDAVSVEDAGGVREVPAPL